MRLTLIIICGILIGGFLFISCKKDLTPESEPVVTAVATDLDAQAETARRQRLFYGDTIFYPTGITRNYFINIRGTPPVPGYFKAIPLGLALDSATGRINVNRSESGIRYKVFFVARSTGAFLDSNQIVIAGIGYTDGIYTLNEGESIAYPVYNSNPSLPLPCDDDDDDEACVFDETDLNNDGNDDIPGVNDFGFKVNEDNGQLDLGGSLGSGALGPDPQDGDNAEYEFYYRLNDLSNMSLQRIKVQLYFYNRAADVPQWLRDTINARRAQDTRVNARRPPAPPQRTTVTGGEVSTSKVSELFARPKRPPIIIVTYY